MQINKYFKELNIEPIYEIDIREKCEFANKVANCMVDTFYDYNLDYLRIVDLIQHTNMYISKIPKKLSPVNYSYIDNAMYISEETEFTLNNKYLLHELIHVIQESKNKKDQLVQLGLCEVLETKIKGLALNEGAVQYVVQKILNNEAQIVKIYDMEILTRSAEYYPIITNLIEQLAFLLGDDVLINSILNSNSNFKYLVIDTLGEDTFFSIQTNMDKILEIKNYLINNKDYDGEKQCIEEIKKIYTITQNMIFSSYFNKMIKKVKTIEELRNYRRRLREFKYYIGGENAENYYSDYYSKMKIKISEQQKRLENKSLIVVKENKIMIIFKKIKSYLSKLVFQN